MIFCELLDNDKPGQMITRSSSTEGFTTDELRYLDGKFTYSGTSYMTEQKLKLFLELTMWLHENLYYPACIKTLKNYIKKRGHQVKKKGTYSNCAELAYDIIQYNTTYISPNIFKSCVIGLTKQKLNLLSSCHL